MHFNAAMLELNARLHQIDQLARLARMPYRDATGAQRL